MGSSMSAPGIERQPEEFECSICARNKNEISKLIDSAPVCRGCVLEIIPKFHDALRHEPNYPVEWSASIRLDPQDFAEFFEDYPTFAKQWADKEREYETPRKDRLYCHDCDSFLGVRGNYGLWAIYCQSCAGLVCSQCGSKSTPNHECQAPEEDEDPLKDLDGFDRCPNEGCNTALCLEDGCNDVTCRMCRTRFCIICKEISPEHEHWNIGKPCPRFNRPGAENALFNEDVEEAADDEGPFVDQEQIVRSLVTETALLLQPLPPIESTLGDTYLLHQLVDEERSRPTLEDTPQGQIMLQHQDSLEETLGFVNEHCQTLISGNQQIPPWIDPALDLALKLFINIDMYIYRARIRAAEDDYIRRHHDMIRLIPQALTRESMETVPNLFFMLAIYLMVAPRRLNDAVGRERWDEGETGNSVHRMVEVLTQWVSSD